MGKNRWPIILSLVSLSAILIAGSFYLDTPVRELILDSQDKGWKKTTLYTVNAFASKYGDWPQLALLGAGGFLLAWKLRSRDWMKIMAAALIASTLAGILVNVSRGTTGRTRPGESPKIEAGWYGLRHEGRWLVGDPRYNAFPSGHTATAVGFAGVLLFARPSVGVIAMALALGIAWSRMYLGKHNLSDVVVSTIFSLAVAWFIWRAIRQNGERWAGSLSQAFKRMQERRLLKRGSL